MKTCKVLVLIIAAFALLSTSVARAADLGTAFTYQGRLNDADDPADGAYDFTFTLYDAETGGNQVGDPDEILGQTVVDGLFTVQLDFGEDVFTGQALWLEIDVCESGGTYETLFPRQELTPVPNALYSDSTRGINVDDQGNVGIGTDAPGEQLHVAGSVQVDSDVKVDESVMNSDMPISSEQSTSSTSYVQLAVFDLPDQNADRLMTMNIRFHARGHSSGETAVFNVRAFCYGDGSTTDLADHYIGAPTLGLIHIRNSSYQNYRLNLGPFAASDNQRWRFIVYYRTRNPGNPTYIDELEWEARSLRYEY